MDMSNQPRLQMAQPVAANPATGGLVGAILLPFEILHRQQWTAPWDVERKPR